MGIRLSEVPTSSREAVQRVQRVIKKVERGQGGPPFLFLTGRKLLLSRTTLSLLLLLLLKNYERSTL